MQIRRIVLYSRKGETRELPFKLGRVNIISGPSERGKSAILAIIDYCLGSQRLGVPAGIIQDAVSWYALELDFDGERMFLARQGAEGGRQSGALWHIQFGEIGLQPPDMRTFSPSFAKDDLVAKISGKLGIGAILIPRKDGNVERRRISFRSGLLYSFQKQNEVANPDLFFHRQGETGIAQQIRDTLPYYLGAISEDIIARQEELKAKKKRLREVEQRLDRMTSQGDIGDEDADLLIAEARRTGLLSDSEGGPTLDQLRRAEVAANQAVMRPGSDVLETHRKKLRALQEERVDLSREIEALVSFADDQSLVESGINEQKKRLSSLHLLPDDGGVEHCPVCHSAMDNPPPAAKDLANSLDALEKELVFVSRDQGQLKEALAKKRAALADKDTQILVIRRQIAQLRETDAAARALLDKRNDIARVGGMIHMFLRVNRVGTSEDRLALEVEVKGLRQAIDLLEGETNFEGVKGRIATFLGGVGQTITEWARSLSLAYSEGLLTFDIRGPRLVSESDSGTIPFSRFGSGKNWVWYHLLGHLALHRWFVTKNRPTPRFLIIDQPSQVYFPAGDAREGEEDLEEVRRIYHWLFDVTASMEAGFQVIVTDHAGFADDQRFRNHLAHNWWETDEALIPYSWQ